jgi:heavy metal sensor kinase
MVATQLLSSTGTVLSSSGASIGASPMVSSRDAARVSSGRMPIFFTADLSGKHFRVLAAAVPGRQESLVVAASTADADTAVTRLALILLVTVPLALAVAAVGGRWLAGRALAPVDRMTSTAALIGADSLEDRVPVPPGDDELSRLAMTLNSMLSRLQTDVEDKRRLVADASHELQTPLAVMRAELDVTLASADLQPEASEVLVSAREEIDRMTQIVRNLLTLARFDAGTLKLLRKPLDLLALAEEVAESLQVLAQENDVSVTVAGDKVVADADVEYIRQVARNLVENAIKYAGRDHSVELRTFPDGNRVALQVRDDGQGIPPEALPNLFDRFYRIEGSRARSDGGSGLGLAISREVVEAHGGTLDVESDVGTGTTFTVRLRRPLT